jgi:hypothetical protein
MSLINDALKRASQAQKMRGTPVATGGPLQPVASDSSSRNVLKVVAPLVAVALLATAGWFTWQWWKHRPAAGSAQTAATPVGVSKPAETNAASASAPTTAKLVINTNLVVRPAPGAVAKAAPTAGVPIPAKAATTPAPVVTAPPAPSANVAAVAPSVSLPVEFPTLKLQGIYYRMTKSSVLINGQHLYVGDSLGNVKIVAIDRQSVTLEYKGQKKVLALR